jgi:hypothetical protein
MLQFTRIGAPYAGTTQAKQQQAGFLTCTLPQEPLPIRLPDSGTNCPEDFRFLESGAHSGATVADFHRIPIYLSLFLKNRDL